MTNDEIYETNKCIEKLQEFIVYSRSIFEPFIGQPYTKYTISTLQDKLQNQVNYMNDIIATITGWYGKIGYDNDASIKALNSIPVMSLYFIKPPNGYLTGAEFYNSLINGDISNLKNTFKI